MRVDQETSEDSGGSVAVGPVPRSNARRIAAGSRSPDASRSLDTGRPDAPVESLTPASPGPSREVELAGRLDAVLGIAGRLAASRDRQALFRTIVDETNRALHADATTIRILRDGRLEVAAWAGLSDDLAQRLPVLDQDDGGVGGSCEPGGSSPGRTSGASGIRASSATTGSMSSSAA